MPDTLALKVFTFEGLQLRTVEEDGEIWFVAKDIAQALEYSYWQPNIVAHVPEIWKGIKRINTPGGEQEMLCLKEQGVYFFLGRSDKKKALPYQMWIAGDVVPSIRKHGMYVTPARIEDMLENPDAFIKALQAYKAEKEKREAIEAEKLALEAKAEEDRPKVIFAEVVETSKSSILIGSLAKLLKQNGIDIGPIKLFEWMRQRGYLSAQKGESWNMPTQKSLDMKLFEVRESVTTNPDGSTMIHFTTKVTGKGQTYFINKFKEEEYTLHHLILNEDTLR